MENLFGQIVELRSHQNGPDTSRKAADEHASAAHSNAMKILAWVRMNPGHTTLEIAGALGLEEYNTRPRLTDLKRLGHIRQASARCCNVRKSRMVTWEAI